LPFDHTRAHKLYTALFGEVADLIKGKHLLLILSGPLTQLPFQVLATESPKSAEHKAVRWLARDHALTVLPAASSLKALRRVSKPSAAKQPMIGFGNPLLDGDQSDPQDKKQAELARAETGCARTPAKRSTALRTSKRSTATLAQQSGLADLAELRIQLPLPDTADELCEVARGLNADVNEVRLGVRATEREVKTLSTAGRLANFRIVHFATHGVLAGQLTGIREPGLILTPPAVATDEDDGYLSAGEIAGLKLDADWVILSACNTAGGAGKADEAGAEALSGLARAFFYAQARALLVSHWAVDSDATVKLITSAVGAISQDKSVGRAEALRRAMLSMIDTGASHQAHPAYWAPFVLVGEGGRRR
jgi:CHAT domain-containing protein